MDFRISDMISLSELGGKAASNRDLMNKNASEGEVVLWTPRGALVVIKCTEAVAALLYSRDWAEPDFYIGSQSLYQVLSNLAPILLFIALLFIASCTWTMQVVIGSAYIFLPTLCSFLGILDSKTPGLNHYKVTQISSEKWRAVDRGSTDLSENEKEPHFVRTL